MAQSQPGEINNIEKMKAREGPTRAREPDQIHPRIATSAALKYIRSRMLHQRGLRLCFQMF